MTDKPAGFVETLLTDTDAIAAQFSNAIADAAMASIDRAADGCCWRLLDQEALRLAILAGVSGYLSGEIAGWREQKSSFTWRYDRPRRRLNVMGASLDLANLRSVIGEGRAPRSLDAIVYTTSTMTVIVRGHVLRRLLAENI
jgi:hypothetical protein